VKELLRSVMATPPIPRALRMVNTAPRLSEERRSWLYYHVTKKLPAQPARLFDHDVYGGERLHFFLVGMARSLFWTGTYEADALPLFTSYARDSKVILDVGAAEGVYALFAAAVNPRAKILAFEPGAEQLAHLEANLSANPQLGVDRVVVVAKALSDQAGEAEFYEAPGGTSSLNPTFRAGTVSRVVDVARGDDVVEELLPGQSIDLIKLDTESTEPAALRGLDATVRRDRPVIFCEVLAGRTEPDLQALVDDWGYRTYWLSSTGPVPRKQIVGDPNHRLVNWLFLPDDRVPLTAG
jgi:FkbM family methyltransferase